MGKKIIAIDRAGKESHPIILDINEKDEITIPLTEAEMEGIDADQVCDGFIYERLTKILQGTCKAVREAHYDDVG